MGDEPKCRVLVVDDDEAIVRMAHDVLKRSFDVVTATDGLDGLEKFKQHEVDAVLADHTMPGMTGIELLSECLTLRPSVARILFTATSRAEDLTEAVNRARVHRFITKPIRPLELPRLVEGAIREQSLEDENARLVGELRKALTKVQAHERELEREVERRTAELHAAMLELEQLALRDGLTGLYNHRFFQEALSSELARAARHGLEVGLIFLDVDHFKNYNDLNGHPAGDALLRDLATILSDTGQLPELRFRGRQSDIAARYGGEEFVVILPMTGREGSKIRAERLRLDVEEFAFDKQDVQPGGTITVSVGVAVYPQDGLSKQELLESADNALYVAKRNGRNRVHPAWEPVPPEKPQA